MAKQVVNTDRIVSSANRLHVANNNINSAFQTLQNKAKQLDSNWTGAAGEAARTTMYQLFKNSEVRSAVLRNYINLLERQVSPGYTNAETVNTKLADKFK
jgi:WXG100 family type VII secretion target